jgi:hypothetical protein
LSGQAAFTEELISTEKCHDSFLPLLGNHGQLHSAFLQVEHRIRRIALRRDYLLTPVGRDISALADSSESIGLKGTVRFEGLAAILRSVDISNIVLLPNL